MASIPVCSIVGCINPLHVRGLCNQHYLRLKRHGSPLGGSIPRFAPRNYLRDVILSYRGDDCLLWPFGQNGNGYARLQINKRKRYVHQWACEALNGPKPTKKHEVAHSCGKGHLGCVNPNHLRWATPTENQADKQLHGTQQRGSKGTSTRLTEDQVREIRALAGAMTQRAIAEKYGVSRGAVLGIIRRVNWGWLD